MARRVGYRSVWGAVVATLVAATLAFAVAEAPPAEAATVWTPAGPCGTLRTTTVPAGVITMTVAVGGGAGGDAGSQASGSSGTGSRGGQVSATVPVTPGQTVSAVVGCAGANGANSSPNMLPGALGWAQGGDAGKGESTIFADGAQGGAGGGASAVCLGAACSGANRSTAVAVAGGGGGGGVSNCAGTPGGWGGQGGIGGWTSAGGGQGPSGANGNNGGNSGSSSGGGSAGPGGVNSAGARGANGGDGTNSSGGVSVNVAGGGGGAGYEGGGAGGNANTGCKGAGGGGGGSSWVRSTASAVSFSSNGGDNGSVTVSFPTGDTTAPTVFILRPADGGVYAKGEQVFSSYACTDEAGGTGVAACTGTVPVGALINTNTYGTKSFTVTTRDNAGNVRQVTHNYTVVDGVDPTATIVTPPEGAIYTRTDEVLADYRCADEQFGSGIESCEGPVADGAPIDTSTTGVQAFTVTATDKSGNTGDETHTYTVEELPEHGFSDVPGWIDMAVRWLRYHGHASGWDDGTYRAAERLTRAQNANMLWNIAGRPPSGPLACGGLTDVPAWARAAICWLVNEGHANGFPDRTFRPDDTLTRVQNANMLWGIVGQPAADGACGGLTDVPAWAQQAVCWLVEQGHMNGYPNKTFRPDLPMERGQNANVLYNLFT